jgi:hypothetical protein
VVGAEPAAYALHARSSSTIEEISYVDTPTTRTSRVIETCLGLCPHSSGISKVERDLALVGGADCLSRSALACTVIRR